GNLALIVREGQLAPDGTNRFDSFVTPFSDVPALNNAGQVVFLNTLTGPGVGTTNDTGLFRADGTTLTQIVREGQLAPDGNGRFNDFRFSSFPAFNNSGQVAFNGLLTGTAHGLSDDNGIFR